MKNVRYPFVLLVFAAILFPGLPALAQSMVTSCVFRNLPTRNVSVCGVGSPGDVNIRPVRSTGSTYYLDGKCVSGCDATVEGTVVDDSGESLPGATIRLLQETKLINGAVSDVEGRFRFTLPPGAYTLEVSSTFAQAFRETVWLEAGDKQIVEAVLGALRDAHGAVQR